MVWYDSEIIDPIFAAIFLILLPLNIFNVTKHGYRKKAAYVVLIIFDVVRIAGNLILLVGYEEGKKANANTKTISDIYTAGFILQGIGYSFLFGSTLRFYNRAIGYNKKEDEKRAKETGTAKSKIGKPSNLLHIANIVATVLLIIGLTNSSGAFTPGGTGGVNGLAKVGSYVYCVATAGAILLVAYHLFIRGPITRASRTLLIFVLLALIPMAVRMAYSTYRFEKNQVVNYNVWVHLILNNIAEVLAVVIYIILGFILHSQGGDYELDDRKELMYAVENAGYVNRRPEY